LKKIFFTLSLAIACYAVKAQNTYPWSSTGNVGIGTTAPGQLLDVVGTVGSFSATAKANSSFEQDHTNYRGILLGYDSSGQIGVIGSSEGGSIPSSIAFWNFNGSNYFEAMRLSSTGYLGIGTPTPDAPLDLGANASVKELIYGSGGNVGYYMGFGVNLGQALNTLTAFIGPPGGDGVAGNPSFSVASATTVYPYSSYTTRFTVLATGNVLIGKTTQKNSSYILDVAGTARANGIVVNADGADFVFEPAYKLYPLPALKQYINQNHHLPEIPSAKEMQKDGLNLGENQVKLLQKVEELTLYLINQDEKEKQDENLLVKQQQEIEQLKQQLTIVINALNQKK